MKKIIIIVLISLVVLSGVVVTVMYKMGEKFLDEMMFTDIGNVQSLENQVENDKSNDNNTTSNVNKPDSDIKEPVSQTEVDNPIVNNENIGTKADDQKKQELAPTIEKPKVEPKKQLTPQEIVDIKEEITFSDKMTAATMVMKKLAPSDINELQGMLVGGITPEEKEKIKQLVNIKFSDKEIKKIKEMYHKYLNK